MSEIFLKASQVKTLASSFLHGQLDILRAKKELFIAEKLAENVKKFNSSPLRASLGLVRLKSRDDLEREYSQELFDFDLTGLSWRDQAEQLIESASLDETALIRVDCEMAAILGRFNTFQKSKQNSQTDKPANSENGDSVRFGFPMQTN